MSLDPRIKHIVTLMMENRSCDHLLGLMKAENPALRGVSPGEYSNDTTMGVAVPVGGGATSQGQLPVDPGHEFVDVYMQMYGEPFAGVTTGTPDMSGQQGRIAAALTMRYALRCRQRRAPISARPSSVRDANSGTGADDAGLPRPMLKTVRGKPLTPISGSSRSASSRRFRTSARRVHFDPGVDRGGRHRVVRRWRVI
jgi:hypothetical protein